VAYFPPASAQPEACEEKSMIGRISERHPRGVEKKLQSRRKSFIEKSAIITGE
jgi:hypothetical protein